MLSQMLQSLTGLGGYMSIGMILFLIAFIALTIRTFRMDKDHRDRMSALPLDTTNPDGGQNG